MAERASSTRPDARASSPTSSTTRRAIVAGIAAAPVVALPAVADIAADPIFAALERHRAAREALERTLPEFNRAERQWLDMQGQYPGSVEVLGPWSDFSSEEEIDRALGRLARDCWTSTERRALQLMATAAKRRLREAKEARRAARAACGFTAAEEAQEPLVRDLIEAEHAFASTMPTTLAGALALSEFIRREVRDGDIDLLEQGVETLRAFLQNAGGSHV